MCVDPVPDIPASCGCRVSRVTSLISLVLVLAWARNNHPIFGLNTVLHILHFSELSLETVDWPGRYRTVAPLQHLYTEKADMTLLWLFCSLLCCTFFLQSIDILAAMDTQESPGMENLSPN